MILKTNIFPLKVNISLTFCILNVILLLSLQSWALSNYDAKTICNCIYIIEGGPKANQYYGINPKYVKCHSKDQCEEICINTVNNNLKRFSQQTKEKDFLEYLAKVYCPPNSKVWLKNLKYYLEKG